MLRCVLAVSCELKNKSPGSKLGFGGGLSILRVRSQFRDLLGFGMIEERMLQSVCLLSSGLGS